MRCIHYTNKDGKEGVLFTDDSETIAKDLCPTNCEVSNDFEVDDIDFPSDFPTDVRLEKVL